MMTDIRRRVPGVAVISSVLTARCRANRLVPSLYAGSSSQADRRNDTCHSRRFERHLPEASDLDDIAALDIEGDAGHSPETGITAKDHIDAFACDDEVSALTSSWSGDITSRPQVLSHGPGSCVKGYSTVARHERCRNRRENDLRKARDLNLVAIRYLDSDLGNSLGT